MPHALRAVCVVLSLLWVCTAVADAVVKDLAARTEVHLIQKLTVSLQQLLNGEKRRKAGDPRRLFAIFINRQHQ